MFSRNTKTKEIPMFEPTFPRRRTGSRIVAMASLAAVFAVVVGVAITVAVVAAQAETTCSNKDAPLTFAQQSVKSDSGERRGQRREALEACSNAKKGARCRFSGRDGGMSKGKCGSLKPDTPLVCMPDKKPSKV